MLVCKSLKHGIPLPLSRLFIFHFSLLMQEIHFVTKMANIHPFRHVKSIWCKRMTASHMAHMHWVRLFAFSSFLFPHMMNRSPNLICFSIARCVCACPSAVYTLLESENFRPFTWYGQVKHRQCISDLICRFLPAAASLPLRRLTQRESTICVTVYKSHSPLAFICPS